ncbi:MAG TPA: hypothetical protein VGG48_11820 [Rhizomicrobium sp.]|jgi:hypothetical protein
MLARIAALSLAVLAAAACMPVTTTVPVGSTVGQAQDPLLTGMWKGRDPSSGQSEYIAFFPKTDGTTTGLMMEPGGKSSGAMGFSFQTVALGTNHFMNVRLIKIDEKAVDDKATDTPDSASSANTFPVLYRVTGDGSFVPYLLDEKRTAAAIKAGKIAGTIGPGNYGDIAITASAADLDAFFQTPDGRALFAKPLAIFKKEK